MNEKERKEYNRKYYVENKEKIKMKVKEYQDNNKDIIKAKKAEYYLENKEIINDKCKVNSKIWYQKNKDKKKEYNNNYKEIASIKAKARRNMNPLYKLSVNIRNIITKAYSKNGFRKNSKANQILGCSFEEFKNYLESKFETWMNFDNYGSYNGLPPTDLNQCWDIDHIVPISSAQTEEDIIRLNHYTNLQPLCSYYNRWIKKDNCF